MVALYAVATHQLQHPIIISDKTLCPYKIGLGCGRAISMVCLRL